MLEYIAAKYGRENVAQIITYSTLGAKAALRDMARVLEILVERVSVKGKTNEGVDAVGRGEAIAAHAVALLALHPERDL